MAHTSCSSLFHCVFSTKDRRKLISSELQPRLWAYMGGIARENGMTALGVEARTITHIFCCLCLLR